MIAVPYFEQIEQATSPTDLFPDADSARSTYRRLARYVHPDANGGDQRAVDAFSKLSIMWMEHTGKSGPGSSHPAAYTNGTVYDTKTHSFTLGELVAKGDISNVYCVIYKDESPFSSVAHTGILKMPRSPRNNDLVQNEVKIIKQLKTDVPEEYRKYHGDIVDTIRHKDAATGKERRGIVVPYLSGYVSLRDIMDAYPTGVNPKDMAWMARRLWVALAAAHDAGIAHGAVFPEHVMVHPTDHAVVLIDWSYAKPHGEKLDAGVKRYIDDGWYGSRYDQPLDHRLDIRQAATTLEQLLGLKEARPFRAFFNGCRVASAPPAGQLFQEFDELLYRLYGARKYRPFEMPSNWRKEP